MQTRTKKIGTVAELTITAKQTPSGRIQIYLKEGTKEPCPIVDILEGRTKPLRVVVYGASHVENVKTDRQIVDFNNRVILKGI
jgi:hypothetical protein